MSPAQLRAWRARRQLSQTAAADLLNISRRGYQFYESDRLDVIAGQLAKAVAWAELEHVYPQIAVEIRARILQQGGNS